MSVSRSDDTEEAGSPIPEAPMADPPPSPAQIRATAPSTSSGEERRTDYSDSAGRLAPLPESPNQPSRPITLVLILGIIAVIVAAFLVFAMLSSPTSPQENPTEEVPPDFILEDGQQRRV